MRRVCTAVPGAALLTLLTAVVTAPASPADASLRLTPSGEETGWVSLAVEGDRDGPVVVRELIDDRTATIARLTLRAGKGELRHAVRWRCERRTRRFEARTLAPVAQTATVSVKTPSCAARLRMIVVPASVRPGEAVGVRISDTWRAGAVRASVCTLGSSTKKTCRPASVPPGVRPRRLRLRLGQAGRRTVALRSEFGQRLSAPVEVLPDARLRILVTGDSMTFGLFQTLAGDLGGRATVVGDPHPGRGITTPGFLDWPAHARRVARDEEPDVTIVVLGAADAGYPLTTITGEAVTCCDSPWVAEYARIASGMMTSLLRDGRGLVYWVILPTPRAARKASVFRAMNDGIRQAGAGFDDGVRVIERVAAVLAPDGRYRDAISVGGRQVVVRDDDGVHLSAGGIRIATDIFRQALRADGLVG